jgi:hypothetical protein
MRMGVVKSCLIYLVLMCVGAALRPEATVSVAERLGHRQAKGRIQGIGKHSRGWLVCHRANELACRGCAN